jgi:sugar porter (SP) family MFS transporter
MVCTLVSAFVRKWYQLLVSRLFLGVFLGLVASIVPVSMAESVPARIRGSLVMSWQLWTAFGTVLGLSANLAFSGVGDISWRLQLGAPLVPSLLLLIGSWRSPESPRWYVKQGRCADAYDSLLHLRNTPLQAARDLYLIHAAILEENQTIRHSNRFARVKELFNIPRIRRATVASGVVMFGQQACGINLFFLYSTQFFTGAGVTLFHSLVIAWGFGMINFLLAWVAVRNIDTHGRRSLLLFSFPNMGWSLLAAGLCYFADADLGLIPFFTAVSICFYAYGAGPVPFTYAAEVFPLSHREVGMAWSVATWSLLAAVLSITFPHMLENIGVVGTFGFYAGLNVVASFLAFFLVPEPKQRTLEELSYLFAVPTWLHAKYQWAQTIPYWIQRYVLRRDLPRKTMLYKLEAGVVSEEAMNALVNMHKAGPAAA